jgi:hypothetical protein
MCGIKKLKGPLPGALEVWDHEGITSMDGAEGITRIGPTISGSYHIWLVNNPALISAISLANAQIPASSLVVNTNPKLECVPATWPAVDNAGTKTPHGNCPTSGSTKTGMTVGIAVAAIAVACGLGFICYRRRRSGGSNSPQGPKEDDIEMEIKLPVGLNPVGSPGFDPEEGFPINDSARTLCAKQWTNPGVVAITQHTTRVQYTDLQAATNNFGADHKAGDGGSCVVYKANLYGVSCAIKLLSQDASAWEEKQFTAEIDALSRVSSTRISRQLYACSIDGPNHCLVLELMSTSLEDRMHADPPLSWEQRTYILVCVCRGLVHLHSQSPPMIHRDVKSDNVLISGFATASLDSESIVKIADFGTARADDRDTSGTLQTSGGPTHAATKAVVGTTPYMVSHIAEEFTSIQLTLDVFALCSRLSTSSMGMCPKRRTRSHLASWLWR